MTKNVLKKTGKKGDTFRSQSTYTAYTALTLDEHCNIRTYGDAASNLFGFANNVMIGKPVSKILPDLSNRLKKSTVEPRQPIQLKEVPMKARHANGETLPVMVALRQDYQQGDRLHLVLIRNLQERPKN